MSQTNQKSEFWYATYPSGIHRLDEPPEKISAKVTEGGKKTIQQQTRGRHGLKTVVRFDFRPETTEK